MYRLISLNRSRIQTPIPRVFLLFSASQDHRSLVAKPVSVQESQRCECMLPMREYVHCPKSEVHHEPTVNKACHAAAWTSVLTHKGTQVLTRTSFANPNPTHIPSLPSASTPRPKAHRTSNTWQNSIQFFQEFFAFSPIRVLGRLIPLPLIHGRRKHPLQSRRPFVKILVIPESVVYVIGNTRFIKIGVIL